MSLKWGGSRISGDGLALEWGSTQLHESAETRSTQGQTPFTRGRPPHLEPGRCQLPHLAVCGASYSWFYADSWGKTPGVEGQLGLEYEVNQPKEVRNANVVEPTA